MPDPTIWGKEDQVKYNMVLFTNKDYYRSNVVPSKQSPRNALL